MTVRMFKRCKLLILIRFGASRRVSAFVIRLLVSRSHAVVRVNNSASLTLDFLRLVHISCDLDCAYRALVSVGICRLSPGSGCFGIVGSLQH